MDDFEKEYGDPLLNDGPREVWEKKKKTNLKK